MSRRERDSGILACVHSSAPPRFTSSRHALHSVLLHLEPRFRFTMYPQRPAPLATPASTCVGGWSVWQRRSDARDRSRGDLNGEPVEALRHGRLRAQLDERLLELSLCRGPSSTDPAVEDGCSRLFKHFHARFLDVSLVRARGRLRCQVRSRFPSRLCVGSSALGAQPSPETFHTRPVGVGAEATTLTVGGSRRASTSLGNDFLQAFRLRGIFRLRLAEFIGLPSLHSILASRPRWMRPRHTTPEPRPSGSARRVTRKEWPMRPPPTTEPRSKDLRSARRFSTLHP